MEYSESEAIKTSEAVKRFTEPVEAVHPGPGPKCRSLPDFPVFMRLFGGNCSASRPSAEHTRRCPAAAVRPVPPADPAADYPGIGADAEHYNSPRMIARCNRGASS